MAHLSFIAYRLSSFTDDSITVAQIWIGDDSEHQILVSKKRLAILKELAPENPYNHFIGFLKAIQNCEVGTITLANMRDLSRRSTGTTKIIAPSPFAGDAESAKTIFKKWVNQTYKK